MMGWWIDGWMAGELPVGAFEGWCFLQDIQIRVNRLTGK
jgi:hypothetical protein